LCFFASRLTPSSSSSSSSSAASAAELAPLAAARSFSYWVAARFPPHGACPSLDVRFFSFSYRAMSGASLWSFIVALSLALRLPDDIMDGVSFSLPLRTWRPRAGVA